MERCDNTWSLCRLIISCQIVVWSVQNSSCEWRKAENSECSGSCPCLWRSIIGGMDRVTEICAVQSVFVLFQDETLIKHMGRRRRRAGKKRSGLQEGVWSYWFKMRFSFIYLFSCTHSSRLSACFLLYVLWPQCPIPPPSLRFSVSVSTSENTVCVRVCVHIYTSFTTLCVFTVCQWAFVCTYECAWAFCHYCCMCVYAPFLLYEVREPELVSRDEWYLLG